MTTIRVSDPVELVKVLPYQLGFHPRRSLAAVGLRGRRIALVQRLDLPARPRHVGAAVDLMVGHMLAAQCTAAMVVVYEDEAGSGWAAGAALARRVHEAGIALAEHVVVRGERVYFPDCRDCSPDSGVLLPADADVPAIADFVALGTSPCATRDEVRTRVAAEPGPMSSAVRVAARRRSPRRPPDTLRERALSDWGRFLSTPSAGCAPATAAAAARMAASLADVDVRDLLVAWLCPGLLTATPIDGHPRSPAGARLPAAGPLAEALALRGGARAGAQHGADVTPAEASGAGVEKLCWLARHAPPDLAPGVLAVLACYAWWLGDGVLARAACDRALSIDPAYRLALLLEQMVAWGIRPLPGAGPVHAMDRFDTPDAGSV